jgi:hypothetical protein
MNKELANILNVMDMVHGSIDFDGFLRYLAEAKCSINNYNAFHTKKKKMEAKVDIDLAIAIVNRLWSIYYYAFFDEEYFNKLMDGYNTYQDIKEDEVRKIEKNINSKNDWFLKTFKEAQDLESKKKHN